MDMLRPRCLALAVTFALVAGCGGSAPPAVNAGDRTAATKPGAKVDADALAAEIADTLQACSYDGAPVKVDASAAHGAAPPDCRDMVATIMRHTGLPQNFDVVEANVPNAAAVILLDEQKLPHRVIAFNRDFIDQVKQATQGNRWAPVSIMAHEIGHHLSGHTIMPGGSQPPTELEADKFSGFVLYKMGASLDDALKAMVALVPEGPDGATHPGRGKRVAAIQSGWREACQQVGGRDCAGGAAVVAQQSPVAGRPQPAADAPLRVPAPGDAPIASAPSQPSRSVDTGAPADSTASTASARPARGADVLPAPGSTPSKFDRFTFDEFGVLDPAERARVERRMFELARGQGVEIVTLLVDSLHGMSAEDYAWAMMRQLRVGKLDVGNGAVLVVAPNEGQTAVAMGPGVMLEMGDYLKLENERLRNFLQWGWPQCKKKGDCGGWSSQFFGAAEHIASDTRHWEWTIRYPSFEAMHATYKREFDARRASGARYEPNKDPTWRKIARVEGRLVDTAPTGKWVNAIHARQVGPAMLVRTAGGRDVVLYMDPRTAGLMPAGALKAGQSYSFVVREQNLGGDVPGFDVLSYDLR
ncbi:TPM domain-containing protein [Lysobacter humi (ex Lee et al. 2017)]